MISPGLGCSEHSLNTLRYANRVKELDGSGSREEPPMPSIPGGEDYSMHDTMSSVASDLASIHVSEEHGDDGNGDRVQLDTINALREAEDDVLEAQRLVVDFQEEFYKKMQSLNAQTNEVTENSSKKSNRKLTRKKCGRQTKYTRSLSEVAHASSQHYSKRVPHGNSTSSFSRSGARFQLIIIETCVTEIMVLLRFVCRSPMKNSRTTKMESGKTNTSFFVFGRLITTWMNTLSKWVRLSKTTMRFSLR